MYIIEDEFHAELQEGVYNTFDEALEELKRRSKIPWNEIPNRCPCIGWENCERNYQIIEYDDSSIPWQELRRTYALNISARGIEWTLQ